MLSLILCAALAACSLAGSDNDDSSGNDDVSAEQGGEPSAIDQTPFTISVANESSSTYNAEDIVENVTFAHTVEFNLSAATVSVDGSAASAVTAAGVTLISESASSGTAVTLSAASSGYGYTLTSTLEGAVKYILSGTLDGTLNVQSAAKYALYLNGATIRSDYGPALNLTSAVRTYIVAAEGTENTLSDTASHSQNTNKAALYAKGPLIFSGSGTLNVNGNYKHAIYSADYIRSRGCILNVFVSAKDALRSVNGFIFDDGDLTVEATGTTQDDESKGIKVEGSESYPGLGYIVINGGTLNITSVSKAITAAWDIDEDASTAATGDDPDPYVEINNGVITITTTGTPYETVTSTGTISCSPEAIEGKSTLTVNSGYIVAKSADDVLNAGDAITINGGYLYCASSDNDAIDANGTLTINGGTIFAVGAKAPEGAFDCDNNTFSITGGTLIGIGGSSSTPSAASCTQNVLVLNGIAQKDEILSIVSSSGETVFAALIPESLNTVLISGAGLTAGDYSVLSGGSAGADYLFEDLYLGDLSSSDATESDTFTISSSVTTIGTSSGTPGAPVPH